jgi:hypothetical protein
MRHDVGPYSVLLPGYSTNKTDSGHDSYAPLRIEACRGDTLQIAQFRICYVRPPQKASKPYGLTVKTTFQIMTPRLALILRPGMCFVRRGCYNQPM